MMSNANAAYLGSQKSSAEQNLWKHVAQF